MNACFEQPYDYGKKPTNQQIEDALEVLKCERFARWQAQMTEQENTRLKTLTIFAFFFLRKC